MGEECPFWCRSCRGKKMCKAVKPRRVVRDDRRCYGNYERCGLYIVKMRMNDEYKQEKAARREELSYIRE